MPPIICIEVARRGEPVGQGSSPGPHCFVGKDEGSVVPLTGWRIGRRQLAFTLRDDGLHLEDAGGMAPVRVNVVSPSVTATPLWNKLDDPDREAKYKEASMRFPAGRIGQAEDIAAAILYAATNPYSTGATILVDGGDALV